MARTRHTAVSAGAAALALLLMAVPAAAGEAPGDGPRAEGPRVFIVSPELDAKALLKGVAFASAVGTRAEAQVEVRVERRSVEEGGGFLLRFEGLNELAGKLQSLAYVPEPKEKPAEVEAGVSRLLQMGLMRYVAATSAAKRVRIRLRDRVRPTDVVDRWDSWVFSASANGMFQAESASGSRMFFGSFSANRVTSDLKVRMSLSSTLQRDRFDYQGGRIVSRSESYALSGLFAKSLGEHWAIGLFLTGASSTFENLRTKAAIAPSIEYDVFPNSESTRRQLRISYWIGTNFVRYREETIYEKTKENLPQHGLAAIFEVKKGWGTISTIFQSQNYLHDLSKYRLQLDSEISVRVFKGLSFEIHGGGARIRDQVSLPRRGASIDEIILKRKEQATSYSYYLMAGFSYTFGSISSNIVNPRFGLGGSTVAIRITN